MLERRYNQPPGSSRDWDIEDYIRASEFMRMEGSSHKSKRSG